MAGDQRRWTERLWCCGSSSSGHRRREFWVREHRTGTKKTGAGAVGVGDAGKGVLTVEVHAQSRPVVGISRIPGRILQGMAWP